MIQLIPYYIKLLKTVNRLIMSNNHTILKLHFLSAYDAVVGLKMVWYINCNIGYIVVLHNML